MTTPRPSSPSIEDNSVPRAIPSGRPPTLNQTWVAFRDLPAEEWQERITSEATIFTPHLFPPGLEFDFTWDVKDLPIDNRQEQSHPLLRRYKHAGRRRAFRTRNLLLALKLKYSLQRNLRRLDLAARKAYRNPLPQQKRFNALAVRVKQQWDWSISTDHAYVLSYMPPEPRWSMVENRHLIDVSTLLPDDNHFIELNEPESVEEQEDDQAYVPRPTSVIVPDCRIMWVPNLRLDFDPSLPMSAFSTHIHQTTAHLAGTTPPIPKFSFIS